MLTFKYYAYYRNSKDIYDTRSSSHFGRKPRYGMIVDLGVGHS